MWSEWSSIQCCYILVHWAFYLTHCLSICFAVLYVLSQGLTESELKGWCHPIHTCGYTSNSFLFTSLWLCLWQLDHLFTCRNCSMKDSYEIVTGICELSDFFHYHKMSISSRFGVLSLEKKARTMESDTWARAAVQKHLIKVAFESFVVTHIHLQFGTSSPFSQSFSLSHRFLSMHNYVMFSDLSVRNSAVESRQIICKKGQKPSTGNYSIRIWLLMLADSIYKKL